MPTNNMTYLGVLHRPISIIICLGQTHVNAIMSLGVLNSRQCHVPRCSPCQSNASCVQVCCTLGSAILFLGLLCMPFTDIMWPELPHVNQFNFWPIYTSFVIQCHDVSSSISCSHHEHTCISCQSIKSCPQLYTRLNNAIMGPGVSQASKVIMSI